MASSPRRSDDAAGPERHPSKDRAYRRNREIARFMSTNNLDFAALSRDLLLPSGSCLSIHDIKTIEHMLECQLPQAVLDFWSGADGGRPKRDQFAILGMPRNPVGTIHIFYSVSRTFEGSELIREVIADLQGECPAQFLPVGCTPSGHQVLIELGATGHPVWLLDWYNTYPDVSPTRLYSCGSSFAEFLCSLKRIR